MDTFEIAERHFDVERTFGFHCVGRRDPTASVSAHAFAKTVETGDAIVHHAIARDGDVVRFSPAAAWAGAFPLADGRDAFAPLARHIPLRYIAREFPGLRLVPVPWLFDLACSIVLQQRVTWAEAAGQFRAIAQRFGHETRVFPTARRVARLQAFELQALGIDAQRAATLIRVARAAATGALFADPGDRDALRARLLAIPGVGPWTTEMLLGFGTGDPDAVPTGDLHLPHLVTRTLANERIGSDARMLELLEPYRGQRFRVIRLLWAAAFSAPALLHKR
jgi:3-methyladenine DNA glycosylase/8-oxoguanine DNA glycosylase